MQKTARYAKYKTYNITQCSLHKSQQSSLFDAIEPRTNIFNVNIIFLHFYSRKAKKIVIILFLKWTKPHKIMCLHEFIERRPIIRPINFNYYFYKEMTTY